MGGSQMGRWVGMGEIERGRERYLWVGMCMRERGRSM